LPLYGAAAWVVLFWWLRLVPLPLSALAAALGMVSLAAGIWLLRRGPVPGGAKKKLFFFRIDGQSVAVWSVGAGVALVLALGVDVPPGVDGAMHTAVARVLADAQGHPAGFRPLWPVDLFGTYPVGQPTLTALLALSGLSWRSAGLFGHALSYGLAVIAFAAALSRWTGKASGAWIGVAAVLAARNPLYIWTWGGAPNALGMAFAVAALGAGHDALRERDLRSAAVCGLFAAASLLTHGVVVAALGWALPPLIAAALLLEPRLRSGVPALLSAVAVALVLCAPWFVGLRDVLGPAERQWARETMRASVEPGMLRLVPQAVHDVPLIAGALCAALLLARDFRRALFPLALAGALLLLIANARGSWLPYSALLYPDRIAMLMLIPVALLAAAALELRPIPWPALAAAVAVQAGFLHLKTLRAGREHALAAADDLRALALLDAAVPKDCWVLNNYGDGGQWIPALLARPITFPQVNVLFFEEVGGRVHPCAAYRGGRRPYGADDVAAICPGPACAEAGRAGEAAFYRITDPALTVEVRGLH